MFMLEQRIQQQFFESADLPNQTAETLARPLADAAAALHGTIVGGAKVLALGTGQAVALAEHVAALLVGRFERERPPLAALAAGSGAQALARVRALGQPGDALLLVECGDTDTALAAIETARAKDMTVVALVAAPALRDALAETDVLVPAVHERVPRVLELQLLSLHCLCDSIDLQLMGDQP